MRPLLVLMLVCIGMGLVPHYVHPPTHEITNMLICVIAARRDNASYVQRVVRALGSTPTVLIDLDDHYDVQGPTRLVPSDRTREDCDPNEGDTGKPNCVTRQQTRDVALGLRRCSELADRNQWIVMLEDDMLACPHAVERMAQYLAGLNPDTTHAVKFAKFSRAVAFPPGGAVMAYARAIVEAAARLPYDLLIDGDWRHGTTTVYSGSLFSHIGAVSTNPYRNDPLFRQTWAYLRDESCGIRIM